MAGNLFNNQLNKAKFDREGEGPKFLDILGTVLGGGAKAAGAIAGGGTTKFDFGGGGDVPGWGAFQARMGKK
jgi:hypothetical protein